MYYITIIYAATIKMKQLFYYFGAKKNLLYPGVTAGGGNVAQSHM